MRVIFPRSPEKHTAEQNITVTTTDGGKTATCVVTVKDVVVPAAKVGETMYLTLAEAKGGEGKFRENANFGAKSYIFGKACPGLVDDVGEGFYGIDNAEVVFLLIIVPIS